MAELSLAAELTALFRRVKEERKTLSLGGVTIGPDDIPDDCAVTVNGIVWWETWRSNARRGGLMTVTIAEAADAEPVGWQSGDSKPA